MTRVRLEGATVEVGGGPVRGAAGNARRSWSERRGLVLRLVDDRGLVGRGEASPLPGYSPDTFEQAEADLRRFVDEPPPTLAALDDAHGDLAGQLAAINSGLAAPSARFAVETALLDLLGQRLERPMADLLVAGANQRVAICTLVNAESDRDAVAAIEAARGRGVRTFKLKIGRAGRDERAWSRERAVVAAAIEAAGTDGAVRADVNGAWPVNVAKVRLGELASLGLEFIEQPTQPEDMPSLLADIDTSAPALAVDESLHAATNDQAEQLFAAPGCRFAVLKPMVLGGVLRCVALAERARVFGVEPVPSHLFDGPIAMGAYCALAVALQPRVAAGLAPHAGLSAWTEAAPAQLGHGAIEPDQAPGSGARLPGGAVP